MITEAQKQKMIECMSANNFCRDVRCGDCPLQRNKTTADCLRYDLLDAVIDIKTKPEKKLCPTCGHELDKEIEDDTN